MRSWGHLLLLLLLLSLMFNLNPFDGHCSSASSSSSQFTIQLGIFLWTFLSAVT
jgi:hypothetical protein